MKIDRGMSPIFFLIFEFYLGITLGTSLAYVLFVAVEFFGLYPAWQPNLAAYIAFVSILLHGRFWLAFTHKKFIDRPYQVGVLVGAAAVIFLWYIQFVG